MVEISLWEKFKGIWYVKAGEEVLGTLHFDMQNDVHNDLLLYANFNPEVYNSKYRIKDIKYNNVHLFICFQKEVKEKDE